MMNETDQEYQVGFVEGQQVALSLLNQQFEEIHREQERLSGLRGEWNSIIDIVQNNMSRKGGKRFKMKDEDMSPWPMRSENNKPLMVPADNEAFSDELFRLVKMGRDFEFLLDTMKSNDLVKAQWDRLLVAMRLTGEQK
jgi:hypothetical protein